MWGHCTCMNQPDIGFDMSLTDDTACEVGTRPRTPNRTPKRGSDWMLTGPPKPASGFAPQYVAEPSGGSRLCRSGVAHSFGFAQSLDVSCRCNLVRSSCNTALLRRHLFLFWTAGDQRDASSGQHHQWRVQTLHDRHPFQRYTTLCFFSHSNHHPLSTWKPRKEGKEKNKDYYYYYYYKVKSWVPCFFNLRAGYKIPKGCKVFISFRAVHLDPEYFEDARTFNPWRWQVPFLNLSTLRHQAQLHINMHILLQSQ